MVDEHLPGRRAHGAGGQDIALLPDLQGEGPDDPCIRRPGDGGDGDDERDHAAAHERRDGDREDKARKRQKHVDHLGQHDVDGSAEIARGDPDSHADRGYHENGNHGDGERGLPAVQQSREHVAPEIVGAERIL